MNIEELRGKRILIVGYGVEGKATHKYLKTVLPEAAIATTDKSQGDGYLDHQRDFDIAIKSPGVKPELITIPYTTSANLFFANAKGMVIGVTGTKGKSTTASLIHAMLVEAGKDAVLVGNIGNPALPELLDNDSEDRLYVYELSSYVLADLHYSPHISVVINLFPEHLTYHGSYEKYEEAKRQIVAHAKPEDYFVYNDSFPSLAGWAQAAVCKRVPLRSDIDDAKLKTKLIGAHNRDNVRAAMTVTKILEIADEVGYRVASSFHALPHRLEEVGTFKGITFYDDAISTTPESTIAGLKALKNVGTLFLGGEDRGYDFGHLMSQLKKYGVKNVVLFPQTGARIKELFSGDSSINILETESMEAAVRFAYEHTPKGSICLLSTASPSYSLWKDFNEKGDQFRMWIKKFGVE